MSWAIWAWFVTDYLVRLLAADDRAVYVRRHRLELVAALPVDFFRPLRLIRVLRPLGIFVRSTKGMRDVLGLTGFTLIGSIGVFVVLVGGALMTWIEPETTPSIGDGMWWSIVTTTTVGYGDISPTTTPGRVLAGLLMITGIGLLGAVTGEVAERMVRRAEPGVVEAGRPSPGSGSGHPEVDHVIGRLQAWPQLAATERRRLADIIRLLADEEDGEGPG
jgi:voltage-gated potassium channel